MPLHDRNDESIAPPDRRVVHAVRQHQELALAALDRWLAEYRQRNPGSSAIMTPGEWAAMVAAEAKRQRDGSPKSQRVDPIVETAAEHTESIRASLVGFLQRFGIIETPSEGRAQRRGVRAAFQRRAAEGPQAAPVVTTTAAGGESMPSAPQPASSVEVPPAGTPTTIYELLRATLHGEALRSALDVLWTRVADDPVVMPSRQEIEAVWQRYMAGTSPRRDDELGRTLRGWGISAGEAHGVLLARPGAAMVRPNGMRAP